ncbi:MAG: zinc-finger domain-containing protein [Gammaproteobacteria bacterium]|nr:zinc-finger domain-containing protein [Gammaproteobacteria bacterium]
MNRQTAQSGPLIQPNAENHYQVRQSDLPLSCPMPGMHLWNSHPRVFLPIEVTGQAKCPYCGATYSTSPLAGLAPAKKSA